MFTYIWTVMEDFWVSYSVNSHVKTSIILMIDKMTSITINRLSLPQGCYNLSRSIRWDKGIAECKIWTGVRYHPKLTLRTKYRISENFGFIKAWLLLGWDILHEFSCRISLDLKADKWTIPLIKEGILHWSLSITYINVLVTSHLIIIIYWNLTSGNLTLFDII